MFDKPRVLSIISEWDSINLMSHAPDDEYEPEVDEIMGALGEPIAPELLAAVIQAVFLQQFREDRFLCSKDECLMIAERILSSSR